MENVTTEQLKQLQGEGKKLMVDFWAKWCGPCKMLIPRLEDLESQYPDVKFVKVDVDENMDVALELGIRGVPTVIAYVGEKQINRTSGVQSDSFYKGVLNDVLNG
jgi:thioredoxin 1